jgi:hypothetical protein
MITQKSQKSYEKEAPESKTHEEVHDYGDGDRSVREIAVTEPAVPVEE